MPRTKSVRFLSNIRSKFPLTFFRAIFTSLQYEYRLFSFPLLWFLAIEDTNYFDYSFTFYTHIYMPTHKICWIFFKSYTLIPFLNVQKITIPCQKQNGKQKTKENLCDQNNKKRRRNGSFTVALLCLLSFTGSKFFVYMVCESNVCTCIHRKKIR